MLITWISDYYSLLAVEYDVFIISIKLLDCNIRFIGSLVFMAHRLLEAKMRSALNYMTLVT